jgi:uncharacterized protein (DUF1697 family)
VAYCQIVTVIGQAEVIREKHGRRTPQPGSTRVNLLFYDRIGHNGSVRYLALLRGINVGGKNIIKMSDLRRVFESLGCKDVTTYIQSGNVLFESAHKSTARLSASIEGALAVEFTGEFPVVVLSRRELEQVTKNAPAGFGGDSARYRYDVVFVRPPLRADRILPTVILKPGVDEACERNGVLYLRKLVSRASQSHLPRLVRNAAYSSMTVRNWRTVTELCRLVTSVTGQAG